jgi:hypothetical protein
VNAILSDLKEWASVGVVLLVLVALPIGIFVSLRRNRRDIASFDYPDLTELKLCVPGHQVKWLTKKMGKMGWLLISEEPDAKFKHNSHVRFNKANSDAKPLKDVLFSLNRSLALPVFPLNLRREDTPDNAQTH